MIADANAIATKARCVWCRICAHWSPSFQLGGTAATLTMATNSGHSDELDAIFKQKRLLRTQVRKTLRAMDLSLRSQHDNEIQNMILGATWFKSSHRLCAYISCSALREVDTSKLLSHILQDPATVMQANEPVDLFLLPGLAFDKSGRRLGRGGGYYDNFLRNYQDLAKARNWEQPLFVALSYSEQILDEGVIPTTSSDVPVDVLVSPAGVIPISAAALNRYS
ncbi:5-formyltetrahydrofolate cyclo-ligase, mitochondrial-like isoform X2 [Prosopis cineraria]|uniref:5-formyltetrahydrofolate cyclo-ligase, mitochondrial-like isoform X2 n=1 Tax=Prosopis cineraria TaxID=364024 RepID=UPI00240EE92C|nr:5-formyltetrahydrofolate cyclo-ligase, mitochondrial-like isoform X2 [Prosopis cineraria]